jgi:hypothetical protein
LRAFGEKIGSGRGLGDDLRARDRRRDAHPCRRDLRLDAVRDGLLYGDYEGGQRVISRFGVIPGKSGWTISIVRHWQLDRQNPR